MAVSPMPALCLTTEGRFDGQSQGTHLLFTSEYHQLSENPHVHQWCWNWAGIWQMCPCHSSRSNEPPCRAPPHALVNWLRLKYRPVAIPSFSAFPSSSSPMTQTFTRSTSKGIIPWQANTPIQVLFFTCFARKPVGLSHPCRGTRFGRCK